MDERVGGSASYASFPKDGRLWWVCWIDNLDKGLNGSGTAGLQVRLSLLPEGSDRRRPPSVKDVVKKRAQFAECRVHAGSVVDILLGSIFEDGKRVGQLRMDTADMLLETGLKVDLISAAVAFERLPSDSRPPLCMTRHFNNVASSHYYPTFPDGLVRNRTFPDGSMCLRLKAGQIEVLLPGSEVLRVFSAPESPLANALLTGRWELVARDVLNEDWTRNEPEPWLIGLRKGLTERSVLPAAAFALTTFGKQVCETTQNFQPSKREGLSPLRAMIPYEFNAIGIGGVGVAMEEPGSVKRFLFLRIDCVSFPKGLKELPSKIIYRLDNYNTERRSPGGLYELPPLRTRTQVVVPDPTTGSTNVVNEPPSHGSEGHIIPPHHVEMNGGPEVVRRELGPPPVGPRRRKWTERVAVDDGAAGAPQRGDSGVGLILHAGDGTSPKRTTFDALADFLEAVEKDGRIDGWDVVRPDDDYPWLEVARMVAWSIPGWVAGIRYGWAFLGRKLRRRACLVVSVTVSGQMIYWLEVERRPVATGVNEKGPRALLLSVPPGSLHHTLRVLFRHVVKHGGIWPDAEAVEDIKAEVGVPIRLAPLRHKWVEEASTAGTGRLDAKWASRKIKSFAVGTSADVTD